MWTIFGIERIFRCVTFFIVTIHIQCHFKLAIALKL